MGTHVFNRRQVLKHLKGLALIGMPLGANAAQVDLSLDAFPRDRMIFDSGAARGKGRPAEVPLSGRAPGGAIIEARMLSRTGFAAPWQSIAVADETGRWAAVLPALPRSTGWMRPQVRLATQPQRILTGQEIAIGHVVAIWGQSELHRAVLPAHAALDHAPAVRDPEALQVSFSLSATDAYGDADQFVHAHVSDATPVSAHMAALSNLLAEAAPGERFHLVFHTRAGTGFQHLLDDANPRRRWADDLGLQAFALPAGVRPGLAWMSWYNSDAALGPRYGQVLFAALTGRNADGTQLRRGEVPLGGRLPMDHFFSDLYGPETIWAIAGPHRFEMDRFDAPIAACRASVNRMFEWPHLPGHIRRALEPLTYLNGNPRWKGDFSHPDTLDAPGDGMTRLMLLMGNSLLRQLDLSRWPLPEFDRARLSADGAEMTIWSSVGPVTTTRQAQSQRRPSDTPQVAGFSIDGAPARNVTLSDGRVTVRFDAQGTPFPAGTRIGFGIDGIGSEDLEGDTRERQVWRDYPVVDVGQAVLEGVPVKAQTPRATLDLIPTLDRVEDPAPHGNLLDSKTAGFAPSAKPAGWVKVSSGWSLDSKRKMAFASAETTGVIRASTARGSMAHLAGRNLVLSFVSDSALSGGEELLQVIATAIGGGSTALFKAEVALQHGRRMWIDLGRMPSSRDALSLTFRRRGMPLGELSLGSLGLYTSAP